MLTELIYWSFLFSGVFIICDKFNVFQYIRVRNVCVFCASFWGYLFMKASYAFTAGMENWVTIPIDAIVVATITQTIYKIVTYENRIHF